jgi:hypothetical protein
MIDRLSRRLTAPTARHKGHKDHKDHKDVSFSGRKTQQRGHAGWEYLEARLSRRASISK